MITIARPCSDETAGHEKFLAMLPAIRAQAKLAFRHQDPEAQEEFVAEVVANAFCAYQRLVERGKVDVALPTPLAWYAIRQVRAGRRVGTKLNTGDVLSPANHHVVVRHFDQCDQQDGVWRDALVEDRHAGPADTACARIDLAQWFRSLPRRRRQIAKVLAAGETTKATAKKFNVTAGRVSQMRRELEAAWQQFQGEPVAA